MVRMSLPEALALGGAMLHAGRLLDADNLCQNLNLQWPGEPEVLHLWGVIAYQAQQPALAEERFRQALGAHPNDPELATCLSVALKQQGKIAAAEEAARWAVAVGPLHAGAWRALGDALQAEGRLQETVAAYHRSLELDPQSADTCSNLGFALQALGDLAGAEAVLRRAIELQPRHAGAWLNLGVTYGVARRWKDAMAAYEQALAADPNSLWARRNLGNTLFLDGQWSRAAATLRDLLSLAPHWRDLYGDLANVHLALGEHQEAEALLEKALVLWPDFAAARSMWLAAQVARLDMTAARLKTLHTQWDQFHGRPLRRRWNDQDRDRRPDRPLRWGFVSSDFGRHPVGYFSIRALEALARHGCEIFLYVQRELNADDQLSQRFRAAAGNRWRSIVHLDDDAVAQQIHGDAIDVLFELNGHTAGNRLAVLARKPAPLQVTWLGYEGTTGLEAIDFLLADRHVVPPGEEGHYAEQVWRMPDSYVTWEPPDFAPAVGPPPQQRQGHITLGCFNKPAKITPPVVDAWCDILRRLPHARLLLKYDGWQDPVLRDRCRQWFAGKGIDIRRVELRGWSSHAECLQAYNEIDLALDTYPFSGSATTCDALWMGVPVITLPGATFVSRHSTTHLANLGLADLVARDWPHYVQLVVGLCQDVRRLAALRAGLRARISASVLCDGDRFARGLLALVRHAWRQWAGGAAGRPR